MLFFVIQIRTASYNEESLVAANRSVGLVKRPDRSFAGFRTELLCSFDRAEARQTRQGGGG